MTLHIEKHPVNPPADPGQTSKPTALNAKPKGTKPKAAKTKAAKTQPSATQQEVLLLVTDTGVVIATFVSAAAAQLYTEQVALSWIFAHETGRSGI